VAPSPEAARDVTTIAFHFNLCAPKDIQEQGDCVTHHGLSLVDRPCLRVDALNSGTLIIHQ